MIDMNPAELRKKGIEALSNALGPIGMAKFLQQFETGNGDYTKERVQWLNENDIDALYDKIKKQKKIE